jgi:uncharacterized protein
MDIDTDILRDTARFKAISRGETLWLFDERSLDIYVIDGESAPFVEAAIEGGTLPAMTEEEGEAMSGFLEDLGSAKDLPAPFYRSDTRIGNLKLALSNRCPSACAYCFRPEDSGIRPRPGLVRDAMRAMVGGFGRDSDVYCISFNLTSEPLVDLDQLRELETAVEELRSGTSKEFPIYFCTSGTAQSPAALAAISCTLAGHRLPVSIDGPKEVHDRYRKDVAGRGTYEKVMALIAWARDRGMGLEAQAVLTRSFPYPDLVLEHLLEHGFESISMKPVRAGFKAAFLPEDMPVLLDSYGRYFAKLESSLLDGDETLLAVMKHDFALRPLWKLVLKTKAEGRCIWGTTHIIMDALGDFYPCDSVIGNEAFRCGSVDRGIDFSRFHADVSWRSRKGCASCWARTLCGGTCYVNGLSIAGDHLAIDPIECALTKFFSERCIGLMAALMEAGRDPYSISETLLSY